MMFFKTLEKIVYFNYNSFTFLFFALKTFYSALLFQLIEHFTDACVLKIVKD